MIAAAVGFVLALVGGLGTARFARRFAERRQIIDRPNWRSSHTAPTPRGGGIGILLAFAPSALVAAALLGDNAPGVRPVVATFVAVGLLAFVGYRDDRRETSPFVKLALQLLAAGTVVFGVGAIERVPLPGGELRLGVLAAPLTVFWLVGFSNAFNFMDGIDGIAGLFGGIAAAGFAVAALLAGGTEGVWLAAPLAGASLAFLRENWSPARVFMGDVGSLPLGFLLAEAAVIGSAGGRIPFPAGFLVLGPFLFDTLFTLARRLARRENVLRAHRSHLYQRLVVAGWSHARTATYYGAWTGLTVVLGIVYASSDAAVRAAALGVALLTGVGTCLLVIGTEGKRGKG